MQNKSVTIIQLLLCSILWSTAGIMFKLIDWNPFVISGIRSAIAIVTVYSYLKITKRKFKFDKSALFCGIALFSTFSAFLFANKLTTSANAIVLQYTSPIFIIIISWVFYRDTFSKSDILAVLLTLLGIALFFLDELNTSYVLGNILAILSGVALASMYVFQGKSDEESKMGGLLIGHVLTACVGFIFAFFYPPVFTKTSTLVILFLGVFQISIPYILLALASSNCPPLVCSLIGIIEPLLNPLWVFIFDGEKPGIFAFIGGGFVILVVTLWLVIGSRKADEV